MLIDLAMAKLHLRVVSADEDSLIGLYISGAEGIAQQFLNRNVYASQSDLEAAAEPEEKQPMVVNDNIRIGLLLILSDLYYNRGDSNSASSQGVPPKAAQAFLQPDRIEMGT